MKVYEYWLWCNDESAWVTVWSPDPDNAPTLCPNDTGHTIDQSKTFIQRSVGETVSVQELIDAPKTDEDIPITAQDGPRECDRKPVMVMSPATEGTFTFLSSCGDDLSPTPPNSGRGEGAQLYLNFADAGEDEVEIQFCEPVELHDAHCSWSGNWGFLDRWSTSVRIPATPDPVVNPGGTGNCYVIPTGFGFNSIVPADGAGTHDVDLNLAVPVPDGYSKKSGEGQGFWNVDERWSEVITPCEDFGYGPYNLYDVNLQMFFCKNMDCGDPRGIWDLDAYKAEWISKKWKIAFRVLKVSPDPGEIGGYLMIFRPGAT
jgi:hypothetical protein